MSCSADHCPLPPRPCRSQAGPRNFWFAETARHHCLGGVRSAETIQPNKLTGEETNHSLSFDLPQAA